jgi:hypothetical protein
MSRIDEPEHRPVRDRVSIEFGIEAATPRGDSTEWQTCDMRRRLARARAGRA